MIGFLLISIPYQLFNGRLLIRGVSILIPHAQHIALLSFDNPVALMLTFENVESEIELVQVSQGWYSKSSVCGGASRIHFRNCVITTLFASAVDVPPVGDSTNACILELEVEMRNTSLSPHNQHAIVNVNPPSELLFISVTLTVLSCTAVLEDTSGQIFNTNGPPCDSVIRFVDVVISQQWTPYVISNFNFSSSTIYYTPIAPVSVVQLGSLRNSSVGFISCNVTVVQNSTTFLQSPAALLLSLSGEMSESSVTLRNSSFVVKRNRSSGSRLELFPPLLNLSGTEESMSIISLAAEVYVERSTFVNVYSIVSQLLLLTRNNNSLTMIDGCGNLWCPDSSSGVISGGIGVGCIRHLSSAAMVNVSTPLPAWLSIERCATTKSASLTLSSAETKSPIQESTTLTVRPTASLLLSSGTPTLQQLTTFPSSAEPPVVVQAAAVAIVAPLAGALLATSVAGVIQRSTIAIRFSDCTTSESRLSGQVVNELPPARGEHMAVSENPTRLSFGPAEGAMYRGAAVGNLLIFVGLALVIVPSVRIRSRCKKKSSQVPFSTSMAQLQLPGRAYVVYCVLLQPTITAATGVLLLGLSGPDIALAVVVLAALLILAVWPVWRVHEGCQHLVRCEVRPLGSGVVEYFVGRCVTWVPNSTAPAAYDLKPFDETFVEAANFSKQYSSFFGRVRSGLFCEVFFAFGFLWSMITGVVGALDPTDPNSCQAAQVTLVVVAALSLTSLVAVR
ncbi:transmembrane protein, putative, partial [Bodo saltans]